MPILSHRRRRSPVSPPSSVDSSPSASVTPLAGKKDDEIVFPPLVYDRAGRIAAMAMLPPDAPGGVSRAVVLHPAADEVLIAYVGTDGVLRGEDRAPDVDEAHRRVRDRHPVVGPWEPMTLGGGDLGQAIHELLRSRAIVPWLWPADVGAGGRIATKPPARDPEPEGQEESEEDDEDIPWAFLLAPIVFLAIFATSMEWIPKPLSEYGRWIVFLLFIVYYLVSKKVDEDDHRPEPVLSLLIMPYEMRVELASIIPKAGWSDGDFARVFVVTRTDGAAWAIREAMDGEEARITLHRSPDEARDALETEYTGRIGVWKKVGTAAPKEHPKAGLPSG